jgi:ATP-dependent Zn protease
MSMRKGRVAPNMSWRAIALATRGFSDADNAELCNEAKRMELKSC